MVEVALLIVVLVLVLVVLVVVLWRRKPETTDIEPAIFRVWKESGLEQKVGELTTHARDIRETHRSIEQMLRVPKERGSFGELTLEAMLSDQLPPGMYGMRSRVLDGKSPDAHIKSTVGLICIDSKFPLDNYMQMVGAPDSQDVSQFKASFIRDVRGHLDKISDDYVCPEKGSAEFAIAYIPSEAVYYFLVTEAYTMVHDFTKKGVQVVSPLTLSHKLELIKTGVHAKKLSEEAESVRKNIVRLSRQFEAVDEAWRVLYETHLRNAGNKADELDQAYKGLRDEFQRISNLSDDKES